VKTIILGDTHGLNLWKQIIELHKDTQRVIFMGDYFDSFDILGVEQIHNFKEIIQFKESTDKEVVMLIGNHDHHYLDVGETYSGFTAAMKWDIQDILKKNMHHLQIAYKLDDILFTHAGVSPVWMNEQFEGKWSKSTVVDDLNELYKCKPKAFNFSHKGFDPSGNSVSQGPLWIRPQALIKSNKGDDGFKQKFIQVVGHTQQKNIFKSFLNSEKAMGNKYYVVDTMPSGGYVIYEDGKLTPIELKNYE